MGVSMLQEYHEGIMIVPKGRSPEGAINNLQWISHSVDTTHTLNDLLLGKLEDERHFYVCGSGFVKLTNYFERYVKGLYQ